MTLKIKPAHIDRLREVMDVFLNEDTEQLYKDAGMTTRRYLWDAFWSACKCDPHLNDVVREIYTYADDTHLYSVFKMLWKEKQNGTI